MQKKIEIELSNKSMDVKDFNGLLAGQMTIMRGLQRDYIGIKGAEESKAYAKAELEKRINFTGDASQETKNKALDYLALDVVSKAIGGKGLYEEGGETDDDANVTRLEELVEEYDIPSEVIVEYANDRGMEISDIDDLPFQGRFDSEEDYAEDMVEQGAISNLSYYLEMYPTDMRIFAQEEADSRVDNMDDNELLYQADLESEADDYDTTKDEISDLQDEISDLREEIKDLYGNEDENTTESEAEEIDAEADRLKSELEDKESELEDLEDKLSSYDSRDELVEKAREDLREQFYDEIYDELSKDAVGYFVNELGYSEEDLAKNSSFTIDYKFLAKELGYDVLYIEHNGDVYVFSNYEKGGMTYAKGGVHNVNPNYDYFAVNKKTNKIVDGWEIVDDVESLKYYAKIDLKDNDFNPKDYNLLSAKTLKARGIDPYSWDSWAKTGEYADGGMMAKGGIPNNYRGKTSENIWNELTENQRIHFMIDHAEEIGLTSVMIPKYAEKGWSDLSEKVQDAFAVHTMMGQYGKGGHTQGYDDREDERLGMKDGRISKKDFVGSHNRREHSRRDDARFEERMADGGGVDDYQIIETEDGNTEVRVGNFTFYFDGVGDMARLKEIYHRPTDMIAYFDLAYRFNLSQFTKYPSHRYLFSFEHPTMGSFQVRGGFGILKERPTYVDGSMYEKGGDTDKQIIELTPIYTLRDKQGFRFYSTEDGKKLYAEKNNEIYEVNEVTLKPSFVIPLQRSRFKFVGLIDDSDVKDLNPLHYERQTQKRIEKSFGMEKGGDTDSKTYQKVKVTIKDVDMGGDVVYKGDHWFRKDQLANKTNEQIGKHILNKYFLDYGNTYKYSIVKTNEEKKIMAKGGETDDNYRGKSEQIKKDLRKIKSGVDGKPPYVFEKDGFIYVSAEEGDGYADYYRYYINKDLEKVATKYGTFWEWEDAGSIMFAPEWNWDMKMGGVTFDEKVESISTSLLKRKKVSPSVQKDYGKTYNKKESVESAKRIAGAMRSKEMAKKKLVRGGHTEDEQGNIDIVDFDSNGDTIVDTA